VRRLDQIIQAFCSSLSTTMRKKEKRHN